MLRSTSFFQVSFVVPGAMALAVALSACVMAPAAPPTEQASVTKLEVLHDRVRNAETPAERAKTIIAECAALAAATPQAPDLDATVLAYLDAALGQAILSENRELLREGEARAAWLLEHSLASGNRASSANVEGAVTLILNLWEETGVLQTRAAKLEAGNLEPYGKRARWLLQDKILERRGEAGGQDVLLARAHRAWEEGADLTGRMVATDLRTESLPSLPGADSAVSDVTSYFEQLYVAASAHASGTENKGLAALRERVKAKKADDPFWQSLDLFLVVRGQGATAEVDAAFDEFLGRYPASTWAQGLLVQYYQGRSDLAGLAARAEALVAKLPKESAYDLGLSMTGVFLSAGRLPEAVAWSYRTFGNATLFGVNAVSTLNDLADRLATQDASDEDREKVAGLIRGLLSEPNRVPGLRLADLRRLKQNLQRLEPRKS